MSEPPPSNGNQKISRNARKRNRQRAIEFASAAKYIPPDLLKQVSELVTEEWFQRYHQALNTGVMALSEQDSFVWVSYTNLNRLSYFLDRCATDDDIYWRVMCFSLGNPSRNNLQNASIEFDNLALSLRQRDQESTKLIIERLYKTRILHALKNGVTTFSLGRATLNKRMKEEKVKELAQQAIENKGTIAHQIAVQATKSRLTTSEYKYSKGLVRPLPGSYGWKQ